MDNKPEDDKRSDDCLYNLCRMYGENARFWRQKFAGLLPEVFKRKLYEKKGFSSVFEFAKKLCGMSEEQVRLVLNLEKRFEKTPVLKELLTGGKVSVNKLARIASIAKPENEIFLATQVQVLSKGAVETLVRDEKYCHSCESRNLERKVLDPRVKPEDDKKDGLQKSFSEAKSMPGQTRHEASEARGVPSSSLSLSPEIQKRLLELQQKGIDINDLLLEFLQKREQEIATKKEKVSQKILQREAEKETAGAQITRHIPIQAKRILKEEYGTKCSMPTCHKQAEIIHHSQRFSACKSHDPRYLVPLCREHHELAHSADLAYHEIKRRG